MHVYRRWIKSCKVWSAHGGIILRHDMTLTHKTNIIESVLSNTMGFAFFIGRSEPWCTEDKWIENKSSNFITYFLSISKILIGLDQSSGIFFLFVVFCMQLLLNMFVERKMICAQFFVSFCHSLIGLVHLMVIIWKLIHLYSC